MTAIYKESPCNPDYELRDLMKVNVKTKRTTPLSYVG